MRWILLSVLVSSIAVAAPVVLEGTLPEGGPDFVMVPFDVPAGTVELEIAHPSQQPSNILDYGVFDPSGFRGWGGGNSENLIIGEQAASRSYLPGPMPAGQWAVVIGKAKIITTPATYRLEIDLRTTATLAPQTARTPFTRVTLSSEARWYQGDLHVHSRESGDAEPTLDAIALFAAMRGLDFVELSDHNTTAQLSWINDAQSRSSRVLFLPGVEFTTYAGHANGIGSTKYVDHRLGYQDVSLDSALAAFAQDDVVFSINHPLLDLGMTCIGCAWKHPLPKSQLGAIEIQTGGFDKTGLIFGKQTLAYWERLSSQGLHLAPVGGSDDHSGGTGTGSFDSPIGNPTTVVFASSLEPSAIVAGIRAGHTVVKLQGPADPMIDLRVGNSMVGDTVSVISSDPAKVEGVSLTATLSDIDQGTTLVVLKDGQEWRNAGLTPGTTSWSEALTEPGRYRAELRVNGEPRTVTNNLWVVSTMPPAKNAGCSSVPLEGLCLLAALAWLSRKPPLPLGRGPG
ncbi:MAG: CehA/McbA family metallohydrolase [Myxococcaceae bacterium]